MGDYSILIYQIFYLILKNNYLAVNVSYKSVFQIFKFIHIRHICYVYKETYKESG
jgi:hypothetical protein